MNSQQTIYALVGPTCTFKSALAIDLASKVPFEIISCDSRLVYKSMDIGTSKPLLIDQKKVPHYMIDVVEPSFNYSVALYKNGANLAIEDIFSRNKIPLVVGGSGLYLNSILSGLSIPSVKPDLDLRKELKKIPQHELYKKLIELDSPSCEVIDKNDNFRTIRALEVIYKTNKQFSSQKLLQKLPYKVFWIGLTYNDRKIHTEKIRDRAKGFCNNDFIDEVKYLVAKYGKLDLFKNTIGYKEAINFLSNKLNLDEMFNQITLHTKQFAKRQMTWFKANKNINWVYLDGLDYNCALANVFNLIEERSLAKTSIVSIS